MIVTKWDLHSGYNYLRVPGDYTILSVIDQNYDPKLYLLTGGAPYQDLTIYVATTGLELPTNIKKFIGTIGTTFVQHIFQLT